MAFDIDKLQADPLLHIGLSLMSNPNMGQALQQGVVQGAQAKKQFDKERAKKAFAQAYKLGATPEDMLKTGLDAGLDPDEIAPLIKAIKGDDTTGGATGVLVDRYMKTTGADFPTALQAVQSGYRQNMLLQDGELKPIPGAVEGKRQLKYGERIGTKQADLEYSNPIEAAKQTGKSLGEAQAGLSSQESKLPQLENTIAKLSELGKKATYTTIGKLYNTSRKELGMSPTEGAVARAEYIALVDNQILPLLRDTFGAQFTQKEGESLRATLGDPDKTPEEKDAVLRSFIDQKKANIESTRRQTGINSGASPMGALPDMGGQSGAKQAPDGNFYIPDPDRPGKYLMVKP